MGLLTDTHCHLNLNTFQDILEPVLQRAWERGIGRILVPGIDVETSRSAIALAERHPSLFAAVGVHPGDAGTWTGETLATLRELARHPKVVAIGEIGLDYYRDRAPRPLQRQVFLESVKVQVAMGIGQQTHPYANPAMRCPSRKMAWTLS